MSTMCVCGDMVQVADLGSDNLYMPHDDPKTGVPCPGHPLSISDKAKAQALAAGVFGVWLRGADAVE